ncbi:hypothetical protein RchiOBHm_Chr5g0038841 [Rosa chinensis]|uniref:Transmembrane protein n=1 Tax=Rosa chinensis TaxID=74649 RepID=A0A2P6QC35_ROSCH|nr:hypothetical protein RchiOBHm_Chr5g0038841 [Rosa chinensis]
MVAVGGCGGWLWWHKSRRQGSWQCRSGGVTGLVTYDMSFGMMGSGQGCLMGSGVGLPFWMLLGLLIGAVVFCPRPILCF